MKGLYEFRTESKFSLHWKPHITFTALIFLLQGRRTKITVLFRHEFNSCMHMSVSLGFQPKNRIFSLWTVPRILTLQQKQKSNTSWGTDIVLAVGWDAPHPHFDTARLFSRGFPRNMLQPRGALGKLLCVSFPFATAVGIFWLQEGVAGVWKAL